MLLVWTLPLLLSCPLRGCWLEAQLGLPGVLLQWERPGVPPRPASAAIARMDDRTWQALTCGAVDLPQRRVHAGLWFRLLRTLLDELSAAVSLYRGRVWEVRSIWERCGHPVRAGLRAWRPYETLDLSVQLHLLEAAAVAIGMLESGDLTGSGTEVALFLPDPARRADRQKAWVIGQEIMAAANEALAQAKRSPEAARNIFQVILFGRTDADAIEQARKLLANLGVPAEFLSQ